MQLIGIKNRKLIPLMALALGLLECGQAAASDQLMDFLPAFAKCSAPPANAAEYDRQAIYVPTADGVKLAVDIFLPKTRGPDGKVPTLYTATRYWRAGKGKSLSDVQKEWLARGFALVNIDVRGTGASFGQWYIPYSPQEAKDIGHIAVWISKQPWSDGKVVMTGNSYPGTTSLIGAAYARGVVKAVAPKFSDWDLYTDLTFPGGIATEALAIKWGQFVHQLDLNQTPPGVMPVDGPNGEALVAAAVENHKLSSSSFDQAAYLVTYKDQALRQYGGLSMNDGGAYTLRKLLDRSGVPLFGWGSWLDSGIAQGLLNRFMTLTNPQLTIIGPWTHGAREDVNLFTPDEKLDPSASAQDQLIQCYLSHEVTSDKPSTQKGQTLLYFTMGENKWKETHVWPIPGTRQEKFYLEAGNALAAAMPADSGEDVYNVDFEASAGPANRWSTQAGGPRIDYGDRSIADRKLLTYTSAPLSHDMEMTGQPVITLRITSTAADGNIFAYLEDVAPDGKTTYITEGELRALHRKLSDTTPPYKTTYPYRTFSMHDSEALTPGKVATLTFQLQATSVLFKEGHRIRLAIAGADNGTFLRIPAQGGVTIHVMRGGSEPSFIDLPVIPVKTPS
jgi:uncharacterized protein